MKRKIGIALLSVAVLLGGFVGWVFVVAFGSNKAVEPGAVYDRATVIEQMAHVSMYLLDAGDGKWVLVDGGMDNDGTTIRAALKEKGATEADLLAVVLTHGHGDHIGSPYALPDVPLYAHEADVDIVEGRVAPKSSLNQIAGPNPTGLKVDETFKGGDILKFGELSIEVFHAPGHTAGNSAFLVNRLLLLGDTAQVTKDDRLHSPPTFFSDDPEQAIASIRKLSEQFNEREVKPNRLVGSHSGSTENVAALLEYSGDE